MDYLNTKADLKILLDDEEKIISNTFSDAKRVKKYQRISKIYKNLLDYYSEVCGKDMTPGEENVKIVSFYSPVGGAGKTTVALVSAEKYAQHGKRTFYISFEDIASEDCYSYGDSSRRNGCRKKIYRIITSKKTYQADRLKSLWFLQSINKKTTETDETITIT